MVDKEVVKELIAKTNPAGNRIDLSWKNPSKAEWSEFAGVRVVRNEHVFPANENDGDVYDTRKEFFCDTGLKGKTIYYYTIFTFDISVPPHCFTDRCCRGSAMASSNFAMS